MSATTKFTKGMTVSILTHGVFTGTATINRLTTRHAVTLAGSKFSLEDGFSDSGRENIRPATAEEIEVARAMNAAFDLTRSKSDRAASAFVVLAYYHDKRGPIVEERVRTYTTVAEAT